MSSIESRSAKILGRLREHLNFRTDTEMADFLSIRQGTLSGWKGRDSIDLLLIIAKCEEAGYSVDWDYVIDGPTQKVAEGMQPYSAATAPRPNGTRIPLFLVPAPAGVATPAHDHVEQMIDVTDLALDDGAAAFACRVVGDSMEGGGIESGDIVIVDRGREPKPGAVVVCSIDGELTIKRFEKQGARVILYPENPRYAPIEIRDGMALHVWGVAIRLVRGLSNSQLPVP